MGETGCSVIIPCYRHRRQVGFAIRSLLEQKPIPPDEIIVVDAAGQDLAAWLRVPFPRVRVVSAGKRLYPGAARNLGARQAAGRRLAFLDADTVAARDWLARLSGILEEHPDCACAGGAVALPDKPTAAARLLHWLEFSEFLPGAPAGPRPYLPACNLLIRRERFAQTGGFPEEPAAGEDLLFFSRHRLRAWFEPATGVRHAGKSSLGAAGVHVAHLGFWSGRLRRSGELPAPRGLGVGGRLPSLLALYRAAVVLGRVVRYQPREGVRAVILAPGLWWLAYRWSRGFAEGWGRKEPT
ncbi:MAG: hypothetical protein Kow00109_10970 [Acidobacteriota bacterium]